MSSINTLGPQFDSRNGRDLANWACATRLPWLVKELGLVAGVICCSISETIRREVYGLAAEAELPQTIDWSRNNVVVSPPGTGKGMAIFVEALALYKRVFVLVPSVIQAHKLEASLDYLYASALGGCWTSQRKAPGLITIITTGIFKMMVRDRGSELWQEGTCLIVDEAQRILEGADPETEFMVAYAAKEGVPTTIVSATIDPARLGQVYGHEGQPAQVHVLNKEMHPIELSQFCGHFEDGLVEIAKGMKPGETYLFFVRSRRGVEAARKQLLKLGVSPVAITGGHEVEMQLGNIARLQKSGKAVAVVATPGTMDSSVTIPGLSVVVIDDARIVVEHNSFSKLERRTETLPINHLWQMIRRVGREKRADGGKDKVVLVTPSERRDVGDGSQLPKFLPLKGCSAYSPLERLVLEAVNLDVPFGHVHEYMLSEFPAERIQRATDNLIDHGMIVKVDRHDDGDGFVLTDKGQLVVSLPYEYEWSRMIVDAESEDMKLWLCMAASWGNLEDVKFFEFEFDVARHGRSEVTEKVNLGLKYVAATHDEAQRKIVERQGLSFRRMEAVETLFELGLRALEIEPNWQGLKTLTQVQERELEAHLVTEGLRVGLFELYLLDYEGKKSWREFRQVTPDGKARLFMANGDSPVNFELGSASGICPVVAGALWFGSRTGNPCASLEDVTVIPAELRAELIKQRAHEEGWMKLIFEMDSDRYGQPQMKAKKDGSDYVPSQLDLAPHEGQAYWCSIDRRIGRGFFSVWIHYPAEQISAEEARRLAERSALGEARYSPEKDQVEQLIELSHEGEKVGEDVEVVEGEKAKQVFRAWVIRQIEYGNSVANFPQFLNCHRQLAQLRELANSPRGRELVQVPTTEAIRIRVYDALDTACSIKEIVFPELFDFADLLSEAQHRIEELRPEVVHIAGSDCTVDYAGHYGPEVTVQEWTKLPREGVKLPDGKSLRVKFVVDGVTYGPNDNIANLQDQAAERQVQQMVRTFQLPVLEIPNSDSLRRSFPDMERREIGTHSLTCQPVMLWGVLAIDPDQQPHPYEWRWMLHLGEAKRLRKEAIEDAAKPKLKGGGASGGGLFGNPANFS